MDDAATLPATGYSTSTAEQPKTPLVRLHALSDALGVHVWAKCEFANQGGSVKDRLARALLRKATEGRYSSSEDSRPAVFEGTSGSTGISLATLAHQYNVDCHIYLPDNTAQGKIDILRSLGARVHLTKPVSFSDPGHYCQLAKKAAQAYDNNKNTGSGFYCDQFETELNEQAHFDETAPEIWNQLLEARRSFSWRKSCGVKEHSPGRMRHEERNILDVFVSGAGTGGTLAGCGRFFKEKSRHASSPGASSTGSRETQIFLADVPGSGLFHYINSGVMFNPEFDREGHRPRRIDDTIVEGIGLNRVTGNIARACSRDGAGGVDGAVQISDRDAVHMAHWLLLREGGLFCGSTAAVNVAAVVKLVAMGRIKPGNVVVTILCDRGERHVSKFWNAEYLWRRGLLPEEYYYYEGGDEQGAWVMNREAFMAMDVLGEVAGKHQGDVVEVAPTAAQPGGGGPAPAPTAAQPDGGGPAH